MTLKRRLERLERRSQPIYTDPHDVPTPVLEAMVRRHYHAGVHTPEEAELYRQLKEDGFEF